MLSQAFRFVQLYFTIYSCYSWRRVRAFPCCFTIFIFVNGSKTTRSGFPLVAFCRYFLPAQRFSVCTAKVTTAYNKRQKGYRCNPVTLFSGCPPWHPLNVSLRTANSLLHGTTDIRVRFDGVHPCTQLDCKFVTQTCFCFISRPSVGVLN